MLFFSSHGVSMTHILTCKWTSSTETTSLIFQTPGMNCSTIFGSIVVKEVALTLYIICLYLIYLTSILSVSSMPHAVERLTVVPVLLLRSAKKSCRGNRKKHHRTSHKYPCARNVQMEMILLKRITFTGL